MSDLSIPLSDREVVSLDRLIDNRLIDKHADGLRWTSKIPYRSAAHEALCEWLRFHHVDPYLVPAASTVVRDEPGCCIWYERIVKDENGLVIRDHEVVVEPACEQGEAPPLPFPPAVQALAWTPVVTV